MKVTVWGKPWNRWTEILLGELAERGVIWELIQRFDWSRDSGGYAMPPYQREGLTYIPSMPTLGVKDDSELKSALGDLLDRYPVLYL